MQIVSWSGPRCCKAEKAEMLTTPLVHQNSFPLISADIIHYIILGNVVYISWLDKDLECICDVMHASSLLYACSSWSRADDGYYDTAPRSPRNMTWPPPVREIRHHHTPLYHWDIQSYWLQCVYIWLICGPLANQIAGEMRHWSTSVFPASLQEHPSLWWMIWAAGPLFFHTCHQ